MAFPNKEKSGCHRVRITRPIPASPALPVPEVEKLLLAVTALYNQANFQIGSMNRKAQNATRPSPKTSKHDTSKRTKKHNTRIIGALQKVLSRENPCDVKVSKAGATCRGGTPCCQGCQHLGNAGCNMRADACKFYFCGIAWESLPLEARETIIALGKSYKGKLFFRGTGAGIPTRPPYIW
jgi:hypothetical protein